MEQSILDQTLEIGRAAASPREDESQGFLRLPLRSLVAGKEVPFDLYLKSRVSLKGEVQFVLACKAGTVFQEQWREKLKTLQITQVYYRLPAEPQVMQYLGEHLNHRLARDDQSLMDKLELVYDAARSWTRHFFLNEKARTGPLINLGLKFFDDVLQLIRGQKNLASLVVGIWEHGDYLYNHCLNVSLMSVAFGSYLGWPAKSLKELGLGALLHDIGMTKIPPHILYKRDKLTPEEMALVRKHPLWGKKMLSRTPQLPVEILQMVEQHHENGDGSGYPWGLSLKYTHSWSRLLRIIDSYESVTASRPWRPALSPKEALAAMRHEWQQSHVYDTPLLRNFIKFLVGG